MGEITIFYPYIVDGKITFENETSNTIPFDRFWKFTYESLSWTDKQLAAIGKNDNMANLYEPYGNDSCEPLVYSNDEDLNTQLQRIAAYNSKLREAPFISTYIGCPIGDIDVCIVDAAEMALADFDYVIEMEGDKTICVTFSDDRDRTGFEDNLRSYIEEIKKDLDGVLWEIFPSRLGKIDTLKMAYAMTRANARSKARVELVEENVQNIVYGAMIEKVFGFDKNPDDDGKQVQAYDLFAEGVLAIINYAGFNKF